MTEHGPAAVSATEPSCPFCSPDESRVFHRGTSVVGIWDAFPVSPGHAILVPMRHVASWFDATSEEQDDLMRAVATARATIEESSRPAGYNIGINVGQAAGQTVMHLHVHVIPRFVGDVDDPAGGVRFVIPERGDYRRPGRLPKATR
jgi:diadenosine tetraphosphate (Ap4A) HIT family hydrolase